MHKTVTLEGASVEYEATPSSYTYHWNQGDKATVDADAEPFTTTDPGAPHPHQTITWQYTDAHETVHPSLDITYTGRFRINGKRWRPLTTTHTVVGAAHDLSVLEAKPTLVN